MDALLFLSRHLWGGAPGVRQEMQQSRRHPRWTALSRRAAAIQTLPDQRPLSRYGKQNKGRRRDNGKVLTHVCVQWTGRGQSGQAGASANRPSAGGTCAAYSSGAARNAGASVSTGLTTAPSAAASSSRRRRPATTSTSATVGGGARLGSL